MSVKYLDNDLIKIDKTEALRYLRYKNEDVDENTGRLLDESAAELKKICRLKYVFRIFNLEKEDNNISFENHIKIKSDDLKGLFKHCDKSAVMAATLGFETEKRIRYYSMADLSKALVFDALAAACIESLCDACEAEIKEIAEKEGCTITFRYSPGYGDVPISHQREILSALDAQKLIGLTVSDSSILIPRKSVTAFIGFDKSRNFYKNSCLNCSFFQSCDFSKEGDNCVK
ncbi:MAG TPA: vitamin B12 dependent-methionine synthase activation domain-containing protein [Sedimentibacter sp.]|nr:vitamin B12 dependent-methionine synthase activation domain-containing protein [Sedimentibacter sp.]HOH68972.1 vitamin B12 dependent-methionine synthase activation domain-containing protein [Sedimentibacter sp.]HPW99810.1 vitamin B12 dependent-methionine synthase activation domain-containing protein [Sedimentibacter sp.]HQB63066.1 vitamin B12 dependent-methionine synthase activation domain-containing protein [Sedimentibacter sp.]